METASGMASLLERSGDGRSGVKFRWLVIAIAAGVIALLYSQGFFDAFSSLTAVQETVQGFGVSGPIIYVLVFALGEPFGVAGIILTIAAALIWPWYFAFMLSWAGTLGASAFGLWFARYVGRDFVQKRLPARLNKYKQAPGRDPPKDSNYHSPDIVPGPRGALLFWRFKSAVRPVHGGFFYRLFSRRVLVQLFCRRSCRFLWGLSGARRWSNQIKAI